MENGYFKAVLPDPTRIFGLKLLPLSLGRYRLLRRFECAFVAEAEATATMEDLLLGILICSMRCADFVAFIESRKFSKELKHWGKRIRKEIRADPFFSLIEKYGLFKHYIEEGSQMPLFWSEMEESGSGAHWSQALEVALRSELGYTAEEIDEGPMSKALADYFKLAEAQGLIRLMTAEEIEHGRANAEALSQEPGQKGAICPG